MDIEVKDKFEARAAIVKAMANATRLFIVDELSRGERCVCELRDMIKVDISTVSRHLSILKNAGVVVDEKRGNQVFYRLRTPCILHFIDCLQNVMDTN